MGERKAQEVAHQTFKSFETYPREIGTWWQEVGIDPERVIEQLAEQPSLYAFYAAMLADMKSDLDDLKESQKMVEAQVEDEFRFSKLQGAKKTESEIRSEVVQDTRTTAARKNTRCCQRKINSLKVAVDSMQMRHESLRSISSRAKVELENLHGPNAHQSDDPSPVGKPRNRR